jgi:CubicO group peptidase (beta-lactamase class C family)
MQKRSSRKWINPPCIITCFARGVFLPGPLRTTIGDYAKFLVSVMHNENVNWEITTERLTVTRNLVTPEEQTKACAQAKWNLAGRRVTAGLGLGWQIIQNNDETIVDHSGSDWGVHTHAFSFLNAK